MLSSIRSAGKSVMNRLRLAFATLVAAVPDFRGPEAPLPSNRLTFNAPSVRSRSPHSNADQRRREGLPHGVPGAKLARKAAAGTVGKATLR